ncbi:Hypothetical_protein [Hexamita inflata]|uniref:Hypothetical_protein n=1 Tax=Hexamita inflata TaxID=28002 RepID=A0AA86P337_9EUKA|nr:Hypothetical protein HINF_LOCUS18343 [Hexamita inflata]
MNNNGEQSDGEYITQKFRKEIKQHIQNVINVLNPKVITVSITSSPIYQLLNEQLEEAYQHNDYYFDSCNNMKLHADKQSRSFEDNNLYLQNNIFKIYYIYKQQLYLQISNTTKQPPVQAEGNNEQRETEKREPLFGNQVSESGKTGPLTRALLGPY